MNLRGIMKPTHRILLILFTCAWPLFGETGPRDTLDLRLSMRTVSGDGQVQIGIEDEGTGQNYLLREGETDGRITFVEADETRGMVLVAKDGRQTWLSLTGQPLPSNGNGEDLGNRPATDGVGVLTAAERRQLAVARRRAISRTLTRPLDAGGR